MGRWKSKSVEGFRASLDTGTEMFHIRNIISDSTAKQLLLDIKNAHNADCDAYEARIAELTAELARVKAESLRVVPVHPALPNVAYDWYATPGGGVGWYGADAEGHECVETSDGYHFVGDCQPVRLERWESSE